MKNSASENQEHYVRSDELRIGLYVFVDLPWFKHPFTLNNFRITSNEQVAVLQSLGEARFRYDPARSIPEPGPEIAETTAVLSTDNAPPAQPDAREQRLRLLRDRRVRLERANKAFARSSAMLRNMNRNLKRAPEETIADMRKLVDTMVEAFLNHPDVTLHLIGEECGGEEIYSHCLNVTVLSMMLAKSLGLAADESRALGLGALLHDIGLMDLPDRLQKMRPEECTKAERQLRAMHCEYGLRLGQDLKLPTGVLDIIYQHHELCDGSGYPAGIGRDDIALTARIVGLASHYDTLCNPFDFAQALTPHEALSQLYGQLRNKFDAEAIQRLIRCLGVYPPGSIVSLSNDTVAMVVSVNPERPLRPSVMIYDRLVPKEEALLLDLDTEHNINITGAIRRSALPPTVTAYLSPRRRVVYYFDSNASLEAKSAQ